METKDINKAKHLKNKNFQPKNKVFCIGLSRTGTVSLCEALDILGYNSLHFSLPLFIYPEIISQDLSFEPQQKLNPYKHWRLKKEIKAINTKLDPNMLSSYDAYGDLPIPFYFKELDAKFPKSKFIYTMRNEDKWLKSMKWLYEEGSVLWSHGLLDDEIKYKAYNTYKFDKDKLIKSYRDHHENVMEYFKNRTEDILILNIDKERITFDNLSKFLKRPIPEVPYPKSNLSRKASYKKHIHYKLDTAIPFYSMIKRKLKFLWLVLPFYI